MRFTLNGKDVRITLVKKQKTNGIIELTAFVAVIFGYRSRIQQTCLLSR